MALVKRERTEEFVDECHGMNNVGEGVFTNTYVTKVMETPYINEEVEKSALKALMACW
jgi:hypothetical protein